MKIKMLRTVKVAKGALLLGDRVYDDKKLPGGISGSGLISEGAAVEVDAKTPEGLSEDKHALQIDVGNLSDRGVAADENIPDESKKRFAEDEGVDTEEREFAEHEDVEQESEEEDPDTKEKRKVKKTVRVKKSKRK